MIALVTAISAVAVTKNYGAVRAVSGLDLEIDAGEAICLLGPNGAGKSTTLNLALGLTKPDKGMVRIFDHPPNSFFARNITGYAAQDSDFPPNLTVREILKLVRRHYRRPTPMDGLIERFGLSALADRYTGGFSGGERRRLALALAFAGQARIVFLDEPTTGLDSSARNRFWSYAKTFTNSGGTLVLTTHHLDEIETVASRICLIDQGRIRLEGSVEQIRNRLGQRRVSFECEFPPDLSPVSKLTRNGQKWQFLSPDADELVRQLVQSRISFSNLEVRDVSLEDAIANLVSNKARPT